MTIDTAPVFVVADPENEVAAIGEFYDQTVKHDLFRLGEMCATVIGKYGEGWTLAIADECGVSKQTVGNWAHGWIMREAVKVSSNLTVDPFTPTHLWTLWGLQRKYNLSMDKCSDYLRQLLAERDRGESWSSATLTAIVEAGEAKDGTPPSWDGYYHAKAVAFIVDNLANPQLPKIWRKWFMLAPEREIFDGKKTPAARLAEKRLQLY